MIESKPYKGYIMAFLSYVCWGLLPLYWKQLAYLSAWELLAVRIVMTVVTILLIVHARDKTIYMKYLNDKKIRLKLVISAGLIAVNWGVFVYAINAGYLVQASLGYYINPLISMFLGIFIMKEKLGLTQKVAIFLAACGVIYMTLTYGVFPWISLVLAFTFAFYGLLKKIYQLDSINSLLVEAMYILPFMAIFVFKADQGTFLPYGFSYHVIFLIVAGLVTIVPLVLFSEGAKIIPLSAIGFLQYIAPTLMLLIGVVLYDEAFTISHAISFGLIWSGLFVYSYGILKKTKQRVPKKPAQE